MLKIGITGGIGSGKTTVCKLFETLGIPIYYADERAKKLMTGDKALKKSIALAFGPEIYFKNGRLNRKLLASIVFNDGAKLSKLNALVHPAVAKDSLIWQKAQSSPYTLKEAALLIESNSYKDLDYVIFVESPLPLRIERVMKRDNASREMVIARMKNQMPDEEKIKYANFIIKNDEKNSLILQVYQLHQKFMEISSMIP